MKTNPSLAMVVDRRALRRFAGARSFERGENYFIDERVRALAEHKGIITAKVRATRTYQVKLWVEDGELEFFCSCPYAADGAFCKHFVAVGLAWLDQKSESKGKAVSEKSAEPAVTMDDVRAYLAGQKKNALVDMLMEHAMDDDRLRQWLLLKAAVKGGKGLNLATYREAVDNAMDTGGFVDYGDAYDYAQGIEDAVDSIEELLKEGHAAEVVDMVEYALVAVEDALGSVDDSDGHMGSILERLQDIHHAACEKARPDPEELARRLFEWELSTDWDTFFGATETYADVLGDKGLTVYRTLAEAEWARVPSLGPNEKDPEEYGKRFRITHIMESLARQTGDVEAVVAVKKRDLSCAYNYLRIAETYKQARKYNLALEWAEQGMKAFVERTDSRLREFLAKEYHRRKRHDEAMALVWVGFTDSPTLQQYQNLKSHASQTGQWPAWREKALAFMREHIAKAKQAASKDRWSWAATRDHSELVSVFLWEKDIDAAWREVQEGGCSDSLWLKLAAKREKKHPEDALPIYQARIEPTLARTNKEAYREAVGLLRKVRKLLTSLGSGAEFAQYLESVRAAHKRKRNFMKLLDRARWE